MALLFTMFKWDLSEVKAKRNNRKAKRLVFRERSIWKEVLEDVNDKDIGIACGLLSFGEYHMNFFILNK